MHLPPPYASQAHHHGIQQIQRDAESNFPNQFGAYSAFGGRVCSWVELFEFVRAGLGTRDQISGFDQFVEEPGIQCGFNIEVLRHGHRALERGRIESVIRIR